MLDLLLAALHHTFVVGLIGVLAAELAVVGRAGGGWTLLLRLDAFYGLIAVLLLAVGVLRLVWGSKGADYFMSNPWFWAKMAAFALIGLLSLAPTVMFFGWRTRLRKDASFEPSQDARALQQRILWAEFALIIVVVVCAAAMARYGSF